MSGKSILDNPSQLSPHQTGTICLYYIPSIDEHVRVCETCRLKHRESILLKQWRLIGRDRQEEFDCMACAEVR